MASSISCIIPTFNRGSVLCDTVEMLLNQSMPPLEIILIDQSTEIDQASLCKLTQWEAEGSIQRHYQSEPNASKARNRGAQVSKGEVLLFLDDDIQIDSSFVEAHARNYTDQDVKAVAGQILERGEQVIYCRNRKSNNPEIDWLYFPRNFGSRCETSWMASGNFSIRRSLFFALGGMDEQFIKGACREESDFGLRLVKSGNPIVFDPLASIVHLGIVYVPKGGSRPKDMYFGLWHHFFGHWYFILRHANYRTFVPYMIPFVRGFIINRQTLSNPVKLVSRIILWFAVLPSAIRARFSQRQGLPQ